MEIQINSEEHTINSTLLKAAVCTDRVAGLTHTFYRYPARFSPAFVKAAIETFTEPGDIVFDPFMGGGTTIVEALASGRHAIGTDINSLSEFVSNVKTLEINRWEIAKLRIWLTNFLPLLNIHRPSSRHEEWIAKGYQRNINCFKTWRIRKVIELGLDSISSITNQTHQSFMRCVLLKTSQWALDTRKQFPSVSNFRDKVFENFEQMSQDALAFNDRVNEAIAEHGLKKRPEKHCINSSIIGIEDHPVFKKKKAPKLILTSPPYPGVHILYHRWQVNGGKETPAPYWIANKLDGSGGSYYNFGDRRHPELPKYFEQTYAAFSSIAQIADADTTIVQMIAFSEPEWQLPKYLEVLEKCGLEEIFLENTANHSDNRIWRSVPNRKWYANQKGKTHSSNEVVLFHRLA